MFRRSKKSPSKSSNTDSDKELEICLIGCGPGAMMFLHALNQKKKNGGGANYDRLNVTCYERASEAGGIWRDVPEDDLERNRVENKSLAYKDMWCNTARPLMEFPDYTHADHFKSTPTPAFLPRHDALKYIVARTSVDGALDNVQFEHTVTSVEFVDSKEMFEITVEKKDEEPITKEFDYCIWAGGMNGQPSLPDDEFNKDVLEGFGGKVMHSSQVPDVWECKGEHVMILGDSSSAEDLALRAVKVGAKKVTICARSGDGDASETEVWPGGKVEVKYGVPYKLLKDKKSFKCQAVYWSEKRQRYRRDDDEEPFKTKDVSTIIFGTGYEPNFTPLSSNLQFDTEGEWHLSSPRTWSMANNALTISLGTISPSKTLEAGATCYPEVYRGILISNPKMMMLTETNEPVSTWLDMDVLACLILGYLAGTVEVPKEKEMLKRNQKQMEGEMQIPWLREKMDSAYADEVDELPDGHWTENAEDDRCIALTAMQYDYMIKCLARDMKTCNYPMDLGDDKKLSKLGNQLAELLVASDKARTGFKEETSWRTFRDVDPSLFKSLFTGQPSAPLPAHWLDLKVDEKGDTLSLETLG